MNVTCIAAKDGRHTGLRGFDDDDLFTIMDFLNNPTTPRKYQQHTWGKDIVDRQGAKVPPISHQSEFLRRLEHRVETIMLD